MNMDRIDQLSENLSTQTRIVKLLSELLCNHIGQCKQCECNCNEQEEDASEDEQDDCNMRFINLPADIADWIDDNHDDAIKFFRHLMTLSECWKK
jgi:hypothetical protein